MVIPKTLLMLAIGLFCCVKTTPIPFPEASVSMENGHLKLGIANVGVVAIALFSALNTFFAYFLFQAN